MFTTLAVIIRWFCELLHFVKLASVRLRSIQFKYTLILGRLLSADGNILANGTANEIRDCLVLGKAIGA